MSLLASNPIGPKISKPLPESTGVQASVAPPAAVASIFGGGFAGPSGGVETSGVNSCSDGGSLNVIG